MVDERIEKSNEKTTDETQNHVKKRPPQHVIDKMNRIMNEAARTGKTPGQLEDDVYREMFE
ncbi:MAG: hypothetical protein U9N57_12160 [Pseudomonadota bacterium]|nr:hypothetical protein [Pseudomonadota bacterium]